ncbi:DHS-like NAD/FAD-binding domain-containing protein [Lipomyces orientalis]|uniref:DHS-like NAD/FAD-binding domain-containing protein n=1 Tax=Lipomyces orientalis TaxID=1233043 RepID=A0ACC3TNK5_9ASCO
MKMLRVPYNLKMAAAPMVLPPTATTLGAAISATAEFLDPATGTTALLTGAGISVESGIPDYRGPSGTYTLNRNHRPIFYTEFVDHHTIRKRYWARSFLGWPAVRLAKPNRAHKYVGDLINGGWLRSVVTQNVDSLHSAYVKDVTEIHGTLSAAVCLTCGTHYDRSELQAELARLNPDWADMLQQELDRVSQQRIANPIKDFRLNPDGDLELPARISYDEFKYPTCPACASNGTAKSTSNGAWSEENIDVIVPHSQRKVKDVGVLKPGVVFFGESVEDHVRRAAEQKTNVADKILVVASSLATYSAFRLIKENKTNGKRIGIINVGPVRGEHELLVPGDLRVSFIAGDILGGVVDIMNEQRSPLAYTPAESSSERARRD